MLPLWGYFFFVFSAKVKAVDMTGASDTFIRYFLVTVANGRDAKTAMETASKAVTVFQLRGGRHPFPHITRYCK